MSRAVWHLTLGRRICSLNCDGSSGVPDAIQQSSGQEQRKIQSNEDVEICGLKGQAREVEQNGLHNLVLQYPFCRTVADVLE